ncbi:MAG: hypothetical protein F4039_02370 [Gammaproteobacteria bacterium]|nr:hypothetical protein [Gammaproteobacteria bacterium]MYK42919.1 hypothetical protein [Gammaproteobacteria bacterium]
MTPKNYIVLTFKFLLLLVFWFVVVQLVLGVIVGVITTAQGTGMAGLFAIISSPSLSAVIGVGSLLMAALLAIYSCMNYIQKVKQDVVEKTS